MFNIKKELADRGLTEETYEELLNDCQKKINKEIDLDWSEIAEKYNLNWNGDSLRKGNISLVGGSFVKQYYEEKMAKGCSADEDAYLAKLDEKKRELERARVKLNSDKVEYNKWLREDVRNEMIVEKITDAISKLEPLEYPTPLHYGNGNREYLLCFGDLHYGSDFDLKDLFGDTINRYSPEICEARMNELLAQTIDIIEKENIGVLNVFNLADDVDGMLRVSQLTKLRFGVVEQTIGVANLIANWLNELSKHVVVKYYQTLGNHDQLRELGMPKNTFVEDNMMKIILEFIKARTEGNENIKIMENPTSYCYVQLCCYNILGIHGEVKSMNKAIDSFSNMYQVPIDVLIGAHLHHDKRETVGYNREVLNIPSIIGVDDYSLSLGKASNPGASLFVFEQLKGKVCEYSIKFIN